MQTNKKKKSTSNMERPGTIAERRKRPASIRSGNLKNCGVGKKERHPNPKKKKQPARSPPLKKN